MCLLIWARWVGSIFLDIPTETDQALSGFVGDLYIQIHTVMFTIYYIYTSLKKIKLSFWQGI